MENVALIATYGKIWFISVALELIESRLTYLKYQATQILSDIQRIFTNINRFLRLGYTKQSKLMIIYKESFGKRTNLAVSLPLQELSCYLKINF